MMPPTPYYARALNREKNFITEIVQSPFRRPQSGTPSWFQIGSSDPKGVRQVRAFSVLCVSPWLFSPLSHSAAEPQLKRDYRMQSTKRLKMLKKEFLLWLLCLFVAKKILSA